MVSDIPDNKDLFGFCSTRLTWMFYALFLALVAAVYFADLRHLLKRADDAGVFRAHEAIGSDLYLFFSPEKEMASGRIVDEFVLWGAYAIWGNEPGIFHLIAVFAHAAASFALALAFWRSGIAMTTSLVAGLLFLANIAHVETVQWISALEYPLAVLNAALTLCFYFAYVDSGRRHLLWACYGGLLVCVLTHFVTCLLWPLCWWWSWLRGESLAKTAKDLVPVLPLQAVVLWFVFSLTGSHTTTQAAMDASLSQPATQVFADSIRAGLWLLGRLLSMAHWLPIVPNEQASIELWLGAAVLLVLLWLLSKGRIEVKFWSLWTLLFTVPFILAALVHPSISRYVYVASVGSSLLIAWAIVGLCASFGDRGRYVAAIVVMALLISGYLAEDRIANLTRYNSGRYYIVHEDPGLGMHLVREALETDRSLIPVPEAYLYMLEASLMVGEDYRDLLAQALLAVPQDQDIRLFEFLSSFFAASAQPGQVLNLADFQAEYALERPLLFHRVGILSQHFGNWYKLRGDDMGAIRAYQLSLRHAPGNLNTAMRLIDLQLKNGLANEAIAAVEEVWPFHKDNAKIIYLAGLSFKEAGRLDQADEVVQHGLIITPSAELYTLQAEIMEQRGLSLQVAEAYRHAIAAAPQLSDPYILFARWHRQQGNGLAAIEVLERAADIFPNTALVYYNLGNAHFFEDDSEAAVAAYQRAIFLDSTHAAAHANLAITLRALGRLAEAEQAYRRAIIAAPDNQVFHHDLGMLARDRGEFKLAREALQQAAALGSENPTTYTTLARLYLDEGNRAESIVVYQQIMERDWPDATSLHYTDVGIGLHEAGEAAAAVEAYRRALARDRENLIARTNIGWILYLQGNYDEAIEQFSYVTERQNNAPAQFNLGLVYLAQGDLVAARRAYARGVDEFGREEAVRIGSVDDLQALAERGVQSAVARQLLRDYWSR